MKKIREIENNQVFIHRSIKTRIETGDNDPMCQNYQVFIHRSIKTRIETSGAFRKHALTIEFLYIDPLKQGLKHPWNTLLSRHQRSFYT